MVATVSNLGSGVPVTQKQRYEKKRGALKHERSTFDDQYKDLAEFCQPMRGRFFTQDRNKGDRRFNKIINNHASWALKVARAGLQAGVMSAARPWFAIETFDKDLMEFQPVKVWFAQVEDILRDILNEGNLYTMAPVMLGELLNFGTGCMTHDNDFEDVARFYTHTVGSYAIAQNDKQRVDTLMREYEMTTEQMVKEFGLGNVSSQVSTAYANGDYYKWYPVVHFIEPNPDRDDARKFSEFKAFRSVKYEPGTDGLDDRFLSKKGFDRFPAYCPRWDLTGEDIYGTDCPAMTALGDIHQLQTQEKRKGQAIDKEVNPPLEGPPELRNKPVSSLPGGLTLHSGTGGQGLSSIYNVKMDLANMRADMESVQERISRAFYVDMFLAITSMQGVQPRNEQELFDRNQERLLQLGPVLERVHNEFLEGLVQNVYNQAVAADLFPPAPEELQGIPVKVRFISSLALAQRSIAVGGIERLTNYVGGLVQTGFESAADKFDVDKSVELYADAIGAPPVLVVADDIVQAVRQDRAQQQAAAAQAEQMQSMANTAKLAADAKTGDKNLLTDISDTIAQNAGQ